MFDAIIAGTFDPVTSGHESVIRRAAAIFGRVNIVVMNNTAKNYMFSPEERLSMVSAAFAKDENITAVPYEGLLADFCLRFKNPVIIKGVRNTIDFEYEYNIAEVNRNIGAVETLLIPASAETGFISSTFVRELIIYNKPTDGYVSIAVGEIITEIKNNRGRQ